MGLSISPRLLYVMVNHKWKIQAFKFTVKEILLLRVHSRSLSVSRQVLGNHSGTIVRQLKTMTRAEAARQSKETTWMLVIGLS